MCVLGSIGKDMMILLIYIIVRGGLVNGWGRSGSHLTAHEIWQLRQQAPAQAQQSAVVGDQFGTAAYHMNVAIYTYINILECLHARMHEEEQNRQVQHGG